MKSQIDPSLRFGPAHIHAIYVVLIACVLAFGFISTAPTRVDGQESRPSIIRADFRVPGEGGVQLFVREVRSAWPGAGKVPIILLHGARVPGVGSFDLPVPGGSLAADLAAAGHRVYVMDARGYGRSTRPPEMSLPPEQNPPIVRSSEVVRDVEAVVKWVRRRTGAARIALLGWATGGHWAGYYATLYSDRLSHLILYNTLYAGSASHAMLGPGSSLEDPRHPGRFNRAAFGAYRLSTGESLLGTWDRNIPVEDKTQWRDPAVAQAYVREALASDPTSGDRNPPSMRSPSGPMEDSFYLASGRQIWDASLIPVPTLVIASERDFWSREEDRRRLIEHLVSSPAARVVVLPDATHFVHLDRAGHGRMQFLSEVLAFLAAPAPSGGN
jgi:pimeloyl-ACP methyl ester carboxylesterase